MTLKSNSDNRSRQHKYFAVEGVSLEIHLSPILIIADGEPTSRQVESKY